MNYLKKIWLLTLWVGLAHPIMKAQGEYATGPASAEHVVAELVADPAAIRPGESFDVALRLTMDPHWHVYWTNPGDTGMAPSVNWDLPEGFEAGPLQFPYPHLIPTPPFRSYGYEGTILLIARVTAPETLEPGSRVRLQVSSDWLVCEDICIPGSAKLALNLPVAPAGEKTPPSENAAAFEQSRRDLPVVAQGGSMHVETLADSVVVTLQWDGLQGVSLDEPYFYFEQEAIVDSAVEQGFDLDGSTLRVAIPKSEYFDAEITSFAGLLYSKSGFAAADGAKAIRFDTSMVEESGGSRSFVAEPEIGFLTALVYAFIGGLILNLMPCVFPVLSIKILGFVQQSGGDQGKILQHGLVFAGGVLVSFWALAGSLLALNAAGENLGWGFQLQSPGFLIGLLVIMFLFGLSLAGVFEIGTSAISLAGKVKSEGMSGSFFSGVLATVVATPCTAPFMGTALGVALAMPAVQAMIVFTMLGLGMAAPYVILSANPKLIEKLPRPGAWMETFKQAMSFPMFLTCVWLIWVLGSHVGLNGLFLVLLGLVTLSLAAWIYGRWTLPHKSNLTRRVAMISGVVIAGVAIWLMVPKGDVTSEKEDVASDIDWQVFSPELVAQLESDGKPYFIDFTADWCLTCKANEARAFTPDDVVERIRSSGVTMVKADWTKRDVDITNALKSYGRSGVPLYVFDAGLDASPVVLPQLLSPALVLEKLAELN